jgi:HD-like signal output (HDOD) protein
MDQAVNYLGFNAVRSLVLSEEVFAQWPDRAASRVLDLEKIQLHAHESMGAVHALSERSLFADDALLAALLHDIGYWILAHECPRELESAHTLALEQQLPMHEAERQVMGASHAEIGAYLLGLWGLPPAVVEAVAYHHTPARVQKTKFDVLAVLALAHALAGTDDAAAFRGIASADVHVDAEYLASLFTNLSWEDGERAATWLNSRGADL